MLNQELITTTITGCGDVLRHQPISEAKIILEFLPRQLRAFKAMRYITYRCPIPRCPMEAGFLLAASLLLPSEQLRKLSYPFTQSRQLAGLTYTCPMAYVVEDGNS